MTYMIIETFHKSKVKTLYERFDQKGRLLPNGVVYLNSWIDQNVEVCYQLMESESLEKLQEWVNNWNDLADFQIIPIISSDEARKKVLNT